MQTLNLSPFWSLFGGACLFFIAFFFAVPSDDEKGEPKMAVVFAAAGERLAAENLFESERLFEKAEALANGTSPQVLYEVGNAMLNAGLYTRADSLFRKSEVPLKEFYWIYKGLFSNDEVLSALVAFLKRPQISSTSLIVIPSAISLDTAL